LTPGQSSDLRGADELLPQVEASAVLADKAYDADERVRELLSRRGVDAVIPSKKNRLVPHPYDKHLYKARHLIENFFAKLKQFRAIARPATTNVLSTFLAVFSLPPPSSYSLRIL